jgi:hypothetical protein
MCLWTIRSHIQLIEQHKQRMSNQSRERRWSLNICHHPDFTSIGASELTRSIWFHCLWDIVLSRCPTGSWWHRGLSQRTGRLLRTPYTPKIYRRLCWFQACRCEKCLHYLVLTPGIEWVRDTMVPNIDQDYNASDSMGNRYNTNTLRRISMLLYASQPISGQINDTLRSRCIRPQQGHIDQRTSVHSVFSTLLY